VQGVETNVVFRPFDHEAATLAKSLPEKFSAETLKDLDKLEFISRRGKSSNSKRAYLEFPPRPPKGFAEEIRKHTRDTYPSSEIVLNPPPREIADEVSPGLAPPE
jgi:hypothetical protein